jgi:hypothetical protein
MSKKKNPREEWTDPGAPTELIGETNAVLQDCDFFFQRHEIENLADLGVYAEWMKESDDEPAHYQFTADETRVIRIAKAAYSLGRLERDAHAYREYLDELLDNHSNNQKSSRKRRKTSDEDRDRVISAWAGMLKTGDVCMKTLAKDVEFSKKKVYRLVGDFKKELRKAARLYKTGDPSVSNDQIEDWIVKQFSASTAGVTRLTVREALKRDRRPNP